ncbi:MAG: hypothetical protein M3Q30_12470 [Actinomycetota bacterium]|nr:hypothetical protein [Actinomycetota bacterium]
MRDEGWASEDDVRAADDIPVAELSDEEDGPRARRRPRGPRSRRSAARALAISLLLAGVIIASRISNDGDRAHRSEKPGIRTVEDDPVRLDVLAALRATTASGSFRHHFRLSESSPDGSITTTPGAGSRNVTITGDGTINVAPPVMVSTSDVPGLGEVTVHVNGTDVWEQGGGNYGMSPGASSNPGAPLSEFAGLVLGTLGPREGAIAMNSMASPTGYLDLAEAAITAASKLGDSAVDGVPVHDYEVTVDATKVVDRPGLTAEEIKTATAALAVLRREGYRTTTVRLSIDPRGFIRAAHAVVRFADGGTVTAETTFSDFGCSTTVQGPDGPAIVPAAAGCPPSSSTASP